MDIFDVLSMLCGLCLFLFGMSFMSQSLERRAGNKLRTVLSKLTTNRFTGFLVGLLVTVVIQSSSGTTVMVIGFVNSGLMTLSQAINVIIGANVGTTATAWILSLSGIESDNFFISLLKPTSFTPILALIGVIFYMFCKSSSKKDTGMILLGFSTLMVGMQMMSTAVSGLESVPEFRRLFTLFENPILGMLAGTVLTAAIQASAASIGILQALSVTGQITIGTTIPIIMGLNIGTCITAILSSIGTNKNAKRAALVHLSFNVIGTVIWLTCFCIVDAVFHPAIFAAPSTYVSVSVIHTGFKLLCTLALFPAASLLEKMAYKLIPGEEKKSDFIVELDERLLSTPSIALERCTSITASMAGVSVKCLRNSLRSFTSYSDELAAEIREDEEKSDHYEDILGTYLIKLSGKKISENDSSEVAKLLKVIGDFERISDHGVNLLESAEELRTKKLSFSQQALSEINTLSNAVEEILDLSLSAFIDNDLEAASLVEPLEQVIDGLKEQLRENHIMRMQRGDCTIEAGFVWSDLLTNLERTADHCSNIAGCVLDMAHKHMNIHEYLREVRTTSPDFKAKYEDYIRKYALQ